RARRIGSAVTHVVLPVRHAEQQQATHPQPGEPAGVLNRQLRAHALVTGHRGNRLPTATARGYEDGRHEPARAEPRLPDPAAPRPRGPPAGGVFRWSLGVLRERRPTVEESQPTKPSPFQKQADPGSPPRPPPRGPLLRDVNPNSSGPEKPALPATPF